MGDGAQCIAVNFSSGLAVSSKLHQTSKVGGTMDVVSCSPVYQDSKLFSPLLSSRTKNHSASVKVAPV